MNGLFDILNRKSWCCGLDLYFYKSTMRVLYFLFEFFLFVSLFITGRFDFSCLEIPIDKVKTIIVDDSVIPVVGTENIFNWNRIVNKGKSCNDVCSRFCSGERESELYRLFFCTSVRDSQHVLLFVGPKIVFPFHEFW